MLYLGSDHAGFKLKQLLKKYLDQQVIAYQDLGNLKYDKNDDYPDFGYQVAQAVAKDRQAKGILVCGSSFGVCIVANKVKGIRAVSIDNLRSARLSREHNNVNILCLSGWDTSFNMAKKIVKLWLKTKFSAAPRHRRRVKKITNIENKELK